ncbi:hypothetical protein E2562_011732 [Oryza meyeriana var. granulata]|uniref:Uncharacterized protein n=1 Tax=Oryza meyeriana var. granulata TaxID=110450 RepID=A0A6G1DH33_9ORYZ|nr:hypothetical protein E2562_011732 [Oryza meyeriana var. granulata]
MRNRIEWFAFELERRATDRTASRAMGMAGQPTGSGVSPSRPSAPLLARTPRQGGSRRRTGHKGPVEAQQRRATSARRRSMMGIWPFWGTGKPKRRRRRRTRIV